MLDRQTIRFYLAYLQDGYKPFLPIAVSGRSAAATVAPAGNKRPHRRFRRHGFRRVIFDLYSGATCDN
jgi:hypothetical protein